MTGVKKSPNRNGRMKKIENDQSEEMTAQDSRTEAKGKRSLG